MKNGDLRQEELRSALRWLVVSTVVLYVFLAGLVVFLYVDSANRRGAIANVATSTNAALCALRHDLEVRVQASRDFIRENPEGVDGLTPTLIRDSIRNQQRTIDALGVLECPAPRLP